MEVWWRAGRFVIGPFSLCERQNRIKLTPKNEKNPINNWRIYIPPSLMILIAGCLSSLLLVSVCPDSIPPLTQLSRAEVKLSWTNMFRSVHASSTCPYVAAKKRSSKQHIERHPIFFVHMELWSSGLRSPVTYIHGNKVSRRTHPLGSRRHQNSDPKVWRTCLNGFKTLINMKFSLSSCSLQHNKVLSTTHVYGYRILASWPFYWDMTSQLIEFETQLFSFLFIFHLLGLLPPVIEW